MSPRHVSPSLALKPPKTILPVQARAPRGLTRVGGARPARAAFWPWAIWAAVAALILVYIAQHHSRPEPAEGQLADLDCLALNIYFEARNEDLEGKRAVGHVVMNRVRDPAFPASVCQVVRAGGEKVHGRCQFSWWCDGHSDKPADKPAWRESREIAWDILRGVSRDPTGGALWYHADYVSPKWRSDFPTGYRIGHHIFYRRPR